MRALSSVHLFSMSAHNDGTCEEKLLWEKVIVKSPTICSQEPDEIAFRLLYITLETEIYNQRFECLLKRHDVAERFIKTLLVNGIKQMFSQT